MIPCRPCNGPDAHPSWPRNKSLMIVTAMPAGTLGAQKPAIAGQAYPVAHNQAGERPMPGAAGMFG